jgi:hypothetical protein
MAKMRVVTVGSSRLVAEELRREAHDVFGEQLEADALGIEDLKPDQAADLFLCLPTRVKQAAGIVPREKIVILELIPDAHFYVRVAGIPRGETSFIFNNNTAQAEMIKNTASSTVSTGLNSRLSLSAKFRRRNPPKARKRAIHHWRAIYVGAGSILYEKYKNSLSPDVTVIGAHRVPTFASIKELWSR